MTDVLDLAVRVWGIVHAAGVMCLLVSLLDQGGRTPRC